MWPICGSCHSRPNSHPWVSKCQSNHGIPNHSRPNSDSWKSIGITNHCCPNHIGSNHGCPNHSRPYCDSWFSKCQCTPWRLLSRDWMPAVRTIRPILVSVFFSSGAKCVRKRTELFW